MNEHLEEEFFEQPPTIDEGQAMSNKEAGLNPKKKPRGPNIVYTKT